VRNVTGTLRAILTGLSYLATFLFAANAVGLSGLGVQIVLQQGQETAGGAKGSKDGGTKEGSSGGEDVNNRY
jgi:hypothetical protein